MKKISSILSSKRGFTLVEAMVSIAILAIGSITIALTFSVSANMMNMSIKYDRDRLALVNAMSTNNYDGLDITLVENQGNVITITLSSSDEITVRGKYIVVKKKDTGMKYTIFVGDKPAAPTGKFYGGDYYA